jgi:hypothetical protein
VSSAVPVTQNQVLSDGSASAITCGLAGQDGEPWVQSYTPAGSAADYVIRDQEGDPPGYVNNGTTYAYATDNPANYTDPTGHGILQDITSGIIGLSVGVFVFGTTGNPLLAAGLGGCAGGATAEFLGGGDSAAVAGGCMVGLTFGAGGALLMPS